MANRRESAWIVLAAACALVVHLFVAGFATSALAGAPGVTLCSGVGNKSHHPPPGEQRDHHGSAECCLSGCPLAGHADIPAAAPLPGPGRDAVIALRPVWPQRIDARPERSPINPRGPPAAA
jgi:hypothetical protein